MFTLMQESAEELCAHLHKHEEIIQTKSVLKKYTTDVIASCAFGMKTHTLKNEDSEILTMVTKFLDPKSPKRMFSLLSYFFIQVFVDVFKLTFADKTATDYFGKIFQRIFRERETRKIKRNDFMDVLINLRKNENESDVYKFDEVNMTAQALTFFFAGSDRTSLTISQTLYEMALNESMQNRLRKEVTESFNKNGKLTFEMIQRMEYLDMVVNETLRKYPLNALLNREADVDYLIEETGFTLSKGTSVIVPIAGLHYDPEYFPDPYKYDPERFSKKNRNNIKPFTYLPFGEGPRICIGKRFALCVIKTTIAYVIKDFKFEVTDETPLTLDFDPGSIIFMESKDDIALKIVQVQSR